MRYKILMLSATLLLCFISHGAYAQEVIPIIGGNATGSGGTVSYSIGQVVYTTNSGTNGSVVQGVQQPYEISVITGLEEAEGITLLCNAYPNPVTDQLIVHVDASATLNIRMMQYQLYDSKGKLIVHKIPDGNETFIAMENLDPATYFLKVIQSGKEVKLFKIIKK